MEFSKMQRFIRPLIIVALASSLAACASKPEPQPEPATTTQYDLKPPPKKPLLRPKQKRRPRERRFLVDAGN